MKRIIPLILIPLTLCSCTKMWWGNSEISVGFLSYPESATSSQEVSTNTSEIHSSETSFPSNEDVSSSETVSSNLSSVQESSATTGEITTSETSITSLNSSASSSSTPDSSVPIKNAEYVEYGMYPKTHVSNSTLISELNGITEKNSLGYVLYNGNYYYQTASSPNAGDHKFLDGTSADGTHWFKVEPIKWKVLSNDNGVYFLFSEYVLDGHTYNAKYTDMQDGAYANNYAKSNMRQWLNSDFYNRAFFLGDSYILTTTVDNSATSTCFSTNPYYCENTEDKVFLLSNKELSSSAYGFSSSGKRSRTVTDFSIARHVLHATNGLIKDTTNYFTRSPHRDVSYQVNVVGWYNGEFRDYGNNGYSCSDLEGICPAIKISIPE